MDKRIAIIIVFAVLVSVVAIAYSSYYERIIIMQEQKDEYVRTCTDKSYKWISSAGFSKCTNHNSRIW